MFLVRVNLQLRIWNVIVNVFNSHPQVSGPSTEKIWSQDQDLRYTKRGMKFDRHVRQRAPAKFNLMSGEAHEKETKIFGSFLAAQEVVKDKCFQ